MLPGNSLLTAHRVQSNEELSDLRSPTLTSPSQAVRSIWELELGLEVETNQNVYLDKTGGDTPAATYPGHHQAGGGT